MKLLIRHTGKNKATVSIISESEAKQINSRTPYELRPIKQDPKESNIIKFLNNLRK